VRTRRLEGARAAAHVRRVRRRARRHVLRLRQIAHHGREEVDARRRRLGRVSSPIRSGFLIVAETRPARGAATAIAAPSPPPPQRPPPPAPAPPSAPPPPSPSPSRAGEHGTGTAQRTSSAASPTVFRATDLPPPFGPVSTRPCGQVSRTRHGRVMPGTCPRAKRRWDSCGQPSPPSSSRLPTTAGGGGGAGGGRPTGEQRVRRAVEPHHALLTHRRHARAPCRAKRRPRQHRIELARRRQRLLERRAVRGDEAAERAHLLSGSLGSSRVAHLLSGNLAEGNLGVIARRRGR